MKLTRTIQARIEQMLPASVHAYAASDRRFNDNQLDRAILNEVIRFAWYDRYAQKMYRANLNT